MLLCSVHLTCTVSNEVTGRPNVKFSFPKSFQAIQWVIKPDKSWNYQQTQVTHTLRATNGVLSGTKATPSVVDIQLLRGKYRVVARQHFLLFVPRLPHDGLLLARTGVYLGLT